jgi:hypothetical protein
VRATAAARAAAFADPEDPVRTIDWALPAVFLSSTVPTDFRPLDGDAMRQRWTEIQGWVKWYDGDFKPVFCGREPFMPLFHRIFGPHADKHGLAVYTASSLQGIGRTRLLRELAAHALRDGNLPLLLTSDKGISHTVVELANSFAQELARVREDVLHLDESEPSQLLALNDAAPDKLKARVRAALKPGGADVTALAVRRALQADLETLRRDARELPHFAASQAVVLMDDVDLYGELLAEMIDPYGLFTPWGLGTNNDPIPVVLTWAHGRNGQQWLSPFVPGQQVLPWLEVAELRPFSADNGEDMMAYQTVALHPFAAATKTEGSVLRTAWAFTPDRHDDVLRVAIRGNLRNNLQGIPDNFHKPAWEAWLVLAETAGCVAPARDEDYLPWLGVGR